MKDSYLSEFDTRQIMHREDFEIFHHDDDALCNVVLHSHSFFEIYYLLSESMDYIVEGERYALTQGTLLLISPGKLHRPDIDIESSSKRFERIVLWMSPTFLSTLAEPLHRMRSMLFTGAEGNCLIIPDENTKTLIESLLFSLLHEKELHDIDSDYMSRLIVKQLLIHLGRFVTHHPDSFSRQTAKHDIAMQVYSYIVDHYQEDLSVTNLADHFFMDKNTLSRQFKRLVGLTPGDFIRRKRLEAAHLLIFQGTSMQEACSRCGFTDYSAFFRAFRRAYGLSPSEYAESCRKES